MALKLRVEPVEGWRGVGEFLTFARRLYQNDARWIRPPELYERRRLDWQREPFWKRAQGQLLLAKRATQTVGRILVFRDHLYEKVHQDGVAFFGLFEAIDDAAVSQALGEAALAWASQQGLTKLRGPIAFSMLEEVGLLVEGFDRPARVRTPYNPPYYARQLETAGFHAVREFAAYEWAASHLPLPPNATGRLRDLHVASLDPRRVAQAVEDFVALHNQACCNQFGFSPVTVEEAKALFDLIVTFGDARLVWQAKVAKKPAGFLLALPDLNESLARSRSGLLALAKALYLQRGVRGMRVLKLGIVDHYQKDNLGAELLYQAWHAALDAGIVQAEFSPVDLQDAPLVQLLGSIGCRRNKRYLLYER